MKNKKLFAILTLVCFMFTLMPVAAFAAMDEQKSYVYVSDAEVDKDEEFEVGFDLNATTGTLYVWFEEVGYEDVAVKAVTVTDATDVTSAVVGANGVITVTDVDDADEITVKIGRVGDFVVHAAVSTAADLADVKDELRTDGDDTVAVVADVDSDDYVIVFGGAVYEDGDVIDVTAVDSVGIDSLPVSFTVYEYATDSNTNGTFEVGEVSADTVYAANVEIDTTSGVDVTDLKAKRNGQVSFEVLANKSGTHKVYVSIDSFKVTFKVDATEGVAEEVEAYYVAKTPVNMDTANGSLANSLVFKIYDEKGNELLDETPAVGSGYDKTIDSVTYPNYVAIVEQPEDSDIENSDLSLIRTTTDITESDTPVYGMGSYKYSTVADGWTINGATFTEEGTYTFKVALDDGTSAKATIKVMEAGDPVALNVTYNADSVQLGDSIKHFAVVHLDKNYVATNLTVPTDVKIAVSGAAVASVAADGTINVKNDEKYVGSEIKVTFVDEENGLVATKTLTVAAEAKELVADVTAVPVDSTKTVTMQLVDEDGNNVALAGVTTASATIVVLDKPADADVTADITTVNAGKGQVAFAFSCDTVGVVEVQVILQTDVSGVVRYYTGVAEIKVGATGIEDTVVMSIGANKIVVNDEVVAIDAAPMIKDSRTFVPFRALAEAFGAVVAYDEATQAVTAELDGTKVVMTIGSEVYTVNGVAKTADVAPFISDSRTMVPVRFAAEAFGITVTPIYAEDGSVADVLFTK